MGIFEIVMGIALVYLLLDKFLPKPKKKEYKPRTVPSGYGPSNTHMARLEKAKEEGEVMAGNRALIESFNKHKRG